MLLQGRYQLEREIGSGAHGTVYRGLDTQTNTPIAIKHLRPDVAQHDPDLLKRFQREAEALHRLNHPNIVQVLAAFAEANDHYIVMEYLPGGSLQDLLKQTPRLPLEQVLRIALDLSDALIRAHRLEIIHRDLKPANIMLAADGTPRLTDFGVAMMRDQERITDTRGIVGTWAYIAPEVINSEPYDARADIWSFGVMLYELLAGRRPFDDSTMTRLIVAILTQPPADLEVLRPDVPLALIDLVYRMLDKMPQARISSMRRVGAELEAILQRLASGESAASASVSLNRLPETDQLQIQPRIKHNLPAQTTPFIGREWEMAELMRLLQPTSKSATRLITLLGPGGMGKSRLALEVAQTLLQQPIETALFPDGIYFVSLAPITNVDRIPQTIADVMGYVMQNERGELLDQLGHFLSEHQMLLILDNFEHLMEGVPMVTHLLEAAPHLTVLVTSRERLNLSAESVFTLDGLQVPPTQVTSPMEYSAVQLFVQSAKRVAPGFTLEDTDVSHVAAICRLVGGLPLGLMLAATWIELLTPQEIELELSKSADFLEATLHDFPERHRSMRAVFEYSRQRLTASEQKILSWLSIFRGPFSRAAAQAVTGASLRELLQMVNKSLLHRDRDTGYYDLHELIRQFAESHLKTNEGAYQAALEAHSRYYCGWLKELLPIMHGTQVAALKALDAEIDNIRQAWQQAILLQDVEALGGAEETFSIYHHARSLDVEAIRTLSPAASMLEALPISPARDQVLGRLYSRLGFSYPPFIDHATAHRHIERSLELLRSVNDEVGISYALYRLAYHIWEKDVVKTEELAQEALRLTQKHHHKADEALVGLLLCDYYLYLAKQYDTALNWAQKSLGLYKQLQQVFGLGKAMNSMASCYFYMQDHQQALEMDRQAQQCYESIENWGGAVICQRELGVIWRFVGEYTKAYDDFQKAIALANEHGYFAFNVLTHRWCGSIARLQGRYAEALTHFEEALKGSYLPDVSYIYQVDTLIDQAELFILMGRLDEVEAYLQETEKTEENLWQDNGFTYIQLKILRGEWHSAKGYPNQAEAEYYKALPRTLEIVNDGFETLVKLLGYLTQSWYQQGHYYKSCFLAHLIHSSPSFIWHEMRQIGQNVLNASRPHLSDEEWAQIEAEATATTLEEYAKSLVQEADGRSK